MAILGVAAIWHRLVPLQPVHLFKSIYVTVALIAIGFGVMMWAWWQFQQHEVAICPTDPTDYLITDGIYRYTRNPMYLGMILMLFGVAVFFGTLPFYIAAIAYVIVMDQSFCPYEEDKLAKTFGEQYAAYESKVRRWI
jgi:protein-S-isoprenylcysteine O-methyltransferase Ste14